MFLLSSQNARWLVGTQVDRIGSSKDPSVLSDAMPVVIKKPVACFARMALARPAHQPLPHQIIVPTHARSFDDAVVVGCPSQDQRIEFGNDLGLWSCL